MIPSRPAGAGEGEAEGPLDADGASGDPAPASRSPSPSPAGRRWSDLRPRLISAAVMLCVGVAAILLGGVAFACLAALICCTMIWETSRMTAPAARTTALAIAGLGVACLLVAFRSDTGAGGSVLLLPALAMALTPRAEPRLAAGWAAITMIAGLGLVTLRAEAGTVAILWLVLVVIASDVMGYFVGRTVGGPKFWPRVSPKKTWSGTIAGWIGAVAVGAGFWAAGTATWAILLLSPFVALTGQMGDIAESWLKRRTGVKDSSALIPGHGGAMDRFDAMIGAVAALMLLELAVTLPLPSVLLR